MDFAQIILSPFVWLLTFFYNFFGSYGIALILFAVVVKLYPVPVCAEGQAEHDSDEHASGQDAEAAEAVRQRP